MTTISITSELDVADKFAILVAQALSGESAYIRAKETIQELLAEGSIDSAQQAEIIAAIISGAVNNINSSCMSTAIAWASAEKDIAFKKLELSKQLTILDLDASIKENQVAEIANNIRLGKVESKRMYGTAVFDSEGNISSLDSTGKVSKDIELTEAQIAKSTKENELVDQKIKESYAAVHKIVSDTYVNYGSFTYSTLTESGITGITSTSGAYKTLSDTQKEIAVEQAKGYTYNAWANALTGSASMLGTAIASDYFDFGPTQPGGRLLEIMLATAENLKDASTPT
jgi:hypothetical protein